VPEYSTVLKQQKPDVRDTLPDNVFVGRQPIFTADLQIHAYELLFRSNIEQNSANVSDGDFATSHLIVNTFMEIGPKSIVGDHPAFINLTRNFILDDHILGIDKKHIVVEILEDVEIDQALIDRVRTLSDMGYIIALDDFLFDEKYEELLRIVDIVKLDVMNMSNAEIRKEVGRLQSYGVKLLAEKIETLEELEFCKSLGFDYYQGYFLSRPKIIQGQRIPAGRYSLMELMQKLYQEEIDIRDLEQTISKDVSLSYRLLKHINSSYFGFSNEIQSVNHALTLLGLDKVRQWATLIAMTRVNDKPNALIANALTRARMCQMMAENLGYENTGCFFTSGLFSNLDVLLDSSMDTLLDDLPLSKQIKSAILLAEGEIGEILQCVIHYENFRWDKVEKHSLGRPGIVKCYVEALRWSTEAMQLIECRFVINNRCIVD